MSNDGLKPHEKLIKPQHKNIRNVLRVVGPVLVVLGFLGFLSPLLAGLFGGISDGPVVILPFIGLPMMFVGFVCTGMGFQGAAARYAASETAPVAVDAINHMAHGTKPAMQDMAEAVGAGLAKGMQTSVRQASPLANKTCAACGSEQDGDAKFCDDCGQRFETPCCPACQAEQDADAKFCDACGAALVS